MATQMNPAPLTGLTGISRRLVAEGVLIEAEARKAVETAAKQKIPFTTFIIEHALVDSGQGVVSAFAF